MSNKPVDIGWEHGLAVSADRRKVQCKYCSKVVSSGITRLKQHIAGVSGEVAACTKCPKEVVRMMKNHLAECVKERTDMKRKKEQLLASLQEDAEYGRVHMHGLSDYDEDDDEAYPHTDISRQEEMQQMRQAMKESRRTSQMEADNRRFSTQPVGGHPYRPSQDGAGPSTAGEPLRRNLSTARDPHRSATDQLRGIDPFMYRPEPAKQKRLKDLFGKENVKKVGKAISKFFLFNAIPFNAADSGPYYQTMIDTIATCGPGVKGPSGYQIGGTYLKEERAELDKYLGMLRKKWPEYGCTIMCDGWSARNKHPITNFMVYCDREIIFHKSVDSTNVRSRTAEYLFTLMDKVVDEVGEENVIQIVTDNEASYKAAGRLLMNKRKGLFWSPCAAHCIDLILEDIGKLPNVKSVIDDARKITSFIYNSDQLVNLMRTYTDGRDLLRPGITRFATEFISIESLLRYQANLKRMFSSEDWQQLSYTRQGSQSRKGLAREVSDLILMDQFWRRAEEVRSLMEPLVLVLKIVDQDQKPTLAVIYDCMDRAKLKIKSSYRSWKRIWKLIDQRWDNQLHGHLHAAAYFLNPACQYSQEFSDADEVWVGLKEVIKRLEPNVERQARAINEIKIFKERKGVFGERLTIVSIKNTQPAQWWYNYGESAPNLRKIAIKVLTQTCSSSGCERNWSTFALIHTKLRNRLAMSKLEELVYVHYNLRLRTRNLMNRSHNDEYYNPIDLNHIFDDEDILDDWIRETEQPILDENALEQGVNVLANDEDQTAEPYYGSSSHSQGGDASTDVGSSSRSRGERRSRRSEKNVVHDVTDTDTSSGANSFFSKGIGGSSGGGGGGGGGGGNYSDQPPRQEQQWAEGTERNYGTHGDYDRPQQDMSNEQRRHSRRHGEFSSQQDYGIHVGDPATMLNIHMRGMQLGGGDAYGPPPSHPLQRSVSTSGRVRSRRGRRVPTVPEADSYAQPPRGPPVFDTSTSTSTGGYYDRGDHGQGHGYGTSASTSTGAGYGYLDRGSSISSGPTGYFNDASSNSSGTQIPYPPPQPYYGDYGQGSSGDTSHDPIAALTFNIFYNPPSYYPQEGDQYFEPHRHSTWE